MAFMLKPRQTVLFTGDSITDASRRERPPLGVGYVRMVADLIDARYPRHALRIINTGIGGDTVRKLFDRWTDDCIRLRPDWLSIMIGINDNHGWLADAPFHVAPDEFERLYATILDRVMSEAPCKLVLMTPFYVSQARSGDADGWRGRVMANFAPYLNTVRRLARRYGAVPVDTHAMFQRQLQHHRPEHLSEDCVHLTQSGNLLLAYEWLRAMGW